MAIIESWSTRDAEQSLLTTQLNSLASNAFSAKGTVIDNTHGPVYGHVELKVAFATAPTGPLLLPLYLIPVLDGSNAGWGGDTEGEPPAECMVGYFQARALTTPHYCPLKTPVLLPNSKFAAVLGNLASQALASSGNVVRIFTFRREVA